MAFYTMLKRPRINLCIKGIHVTIYFRKATRGQYSVIIKTDDERVKYVKDDILEFIDGQDVLYNSLDIEVS